MKFQSFYTNRPQPIGTVLDTETKFVDQSEADRCSLKFQLERFGMDGLIQKLEQTKAQFGYADTRLTKNFEQLANSMADANSYFMQLPAEVRKQFGHDAVKFYSEIENNPQKMYENGFISEKLAKELGVLSLQDKEPVQPIDTQPVNPVVELSNDVVTENESA